MHDSQESNTTFKSWRAGENDYDGDDDTVGGGIKAEWDEYFRTGRVKDYKGFSLRNWWLANQFKYPTLSRVALDLLAVPAISTEVERVFSG